MRLEVIYSLCNVSFLEAASESCYNGVVGGRVGL